MTFLLRDPMWTFRTLLVGCYKHLSVVSPEISEPQSPD